MPEEVKPVGKLTPLNNGEVKPVGELKPLTVDQSYYRATGQAPAPKGKSTDQIIDDIPDLDPGQKDIIRSLAKKRVPNDVMSNAIGTLRGTHPHQEGGNKYYLDNNGIPVPLKNSERPPEGYRVSSIWGSDAEDDGLLTTFSKNLYNLIPAVVENAADIAHLPYVFAQKLGTETGRFELATGLPLIPEKYLAEEQKVKEADWYKGIKSGADRMTMPTSSASNKPLLNTEAIDEYKDVFKGENWQVTPQNLVGTVSGLVKTVGEFVLGGELTKPLSVAGKVGKLQNVVTASYMTQFGEVLQSAKDAGLSTEEAYNFSSVVTVPLALVDIAMGVEGRIFKDKLAKAERDYLIKTLTKEFVKDTEGKITNETLEKAFKETMLSTSAQVKKWAAEKGSDIAGEGAQESLQSFIQKAGEQIYDNLEGEKKFGTDAFSPESFGQYVQEGVAGMIGGAPGGIAYNRTKALDSENKRSQAAFDLVQQGDEVTNAYKHNIFNEVRQGKITQDQADAAITRINAYKEYNDILGATNLEGELKREVFDKTFQKQNLETQLQSLGDPKKLHPLKQAEYFSLQKQSEDLQKDINEIVLSARVQDETIVGDKTLDNEAKKNKPKENLSEAQKAFDEKYKTKSKANPKVTVVKEKFNINGDQRTFEEIPANEYNSSTFNNRLKHRKTAEWLDRQPTKTAFGKVAERLFNFNGKTNSVLGIELDGGKKLRFASSMLRDEGYRGHFRQEQFESEFPVGMPIGIKVEELPAYDEESVPKKVIKAFNANTGKFIGWMKETTQGTSDYSPEQKEMLAEMEMQVEPPLDLFNEAVGPQAPFSPQSDGSISNPDELLPPESVKSEPNQENNSTLVTNNVTDGKEKNTTNRKKPAARDNNKTGEENIGGRKAKTLRAGTKQANKKIKNPEHLLALRHDVYTATDAVQQYFIAGGKIDPKSLRSLWRNSKKEADKRISLQKKGAPTLKGIAHQIWENYASELEFDDLDYYNALEEVLNNFLSTSEMARDINRRHSKVETQDFSGPEKELIQSLERIENQEDLENTEKAIDVLEDGGDSEVIRLSEAKHQEVIDWLTGEKIVDIYSVKSTDEIEAENLLESAKSEVLASKKALDSKRKELDKELIADEEDLFGERKSASDENLFDVRVSAEARNEALKPFKNRHDKALANFKKAEEKLTAAKNKPNSQGEFLFQKKSSNKGNVEKVIKVIQKNFPKVKVVYDPEMEAAGRLLGDTITINPYYAGVDTPIHEAAHILLDAMGDDTIVQQAVAQLKETDLWREVAERYPELEGSALENEVLAEAIGREGADIFKTEEEKSKFKKFLDHIFDWLKEKLGLEKNKVKLLAKQILNKQSDLTGQTQKDQLVGEKAKLRATAMMDLKMAKKYESEGMSPKKIKALTLWEKGVDSKWRYEIQDDGKIIAPEKFLDYFMSVAPGEEIDMGSLTDVYNFPALYDLYPGVFEDYNVILTNTQEPYSARIDEKAKQIHINARRFQQAHGTFKDGAENGIPLGKQGAAKRDLIEKTMDLRGLRRLLGHELQHIIQKEEGFIGGSNQYQAALYLEKKHLENAKQQQGYKDAFGPEKQKFVENYIAEQEGAPNIAEAIESTYRKMAGEVEARNVQSGRFELTDEERKNSTFAETEDVDRDSQILLGLYQKPKINKKDFNYFRDKFLGKDSEQEQEDLESLRELLKDEEITEEEKAEIQDAIESILGEIKEDREVYEEYLEDKKKLEKIQLAEELKGFTLEELIEAYHQADKYEQNEAKLRLAVYLNNEGIDRLSKIKPDIEKTANTKNLTWLEKWNKVLSNISENYPPLQELHKVFEDRHLAKVQEMNKIKAKNEKLAKAVIKEKNGKLGLASDLFSSNSAKYFEYLDDKGKLRTNTSGLSKAQKDYLEFFTNLVKDRNEILDEDGNVMDNTLLKIDKGFWESFNSKEYKQAVTSLLPKSNKESFNWKGALTSRFDRPYEGNSYSKDFYKAANIFIEDITHVKYMKDLVPVVDGIELFYKNIANEEKVNLNNLIDFIDLWKKGKIYQETGVSDPKIDIPLRLLRQLTSVTTMAWNIPANIMNVFIGNVNSFVKDGGKNLILGNKRLGTKKGQGIVKMYDVIKTDYDSNPKLHAGKALEFIAFAGLRFGEIQIQGSQFLGKLDEADMNNFEVKDGEVRLKNTLKDSDGNVISKEEFDRKMIKYRNEVSDTHGKYAEKDKSAATNYEFGKALFQFKQWLPAFWKDKFGAEFINSDNEIKRGTFNYTKKALEELKNDWSNYGVWKGTWKNEQTMSNIKYLAVIASLTALAWADDDDEKKRKQALSVNNALHQMMFVFDLQQSKYMVTSPVAAQGPVTKLLDAMIAITDGDEKKFTKNAKKLVPYNKVTDIPESVKSIAE